MRRLALPLLAAALAFGAVVLATDGGDDGSKAGGSEVAAQSSGRDVFQRLGCGSCHRLSAAGSNGQIGPDLDEKLPNHTSASLTAKILAPGETSMMPQDFEARTTPAELRALVRFLLSASPS
jgi:mono/diheme cytochrome c family protein